MRFSGIYRLGSVLIGFDVTKTDGDGLKTSAMQQTKSVAKLQARRNEHSEAASRVVNGGGGGGGVEGAGTCQFQCRCLLWVACQSQGHSGSLRPFAPGVKRHSQGKLISS